MKKVVSISMTILMLVAVLHISVAKHYCGGHLAASNISLTGKTANCGMEDDHTEMPIKGTVMSKHCCENVLFFFGINGNYFPTMYTAPESFQNNFRALQFCADLPVCSAKNIKSFYANVSPPGEPLPNSVELSKICTLLI